MEVRREGDRGEGGREGGRDIMVTTLEMSEQYDCQAER